MLDPTYFRDYKKEPWHLTPEGRKPINWVEQKENAKREQEERFHTGHRAQLDRDIDYIHFLYGPSEQLIHGIYLMMFFVSFKEWPEVGKELSKIAPAYKLERLHQVWMRICYRPEILGGDDRTITIWHYTGFDCNGRRQRFSAFLEKLIGNGYRGIRRKSIRDKKKQVHIEESKEQRAMYGGISEGSALEASELVLPEVGAIETNFIPGELARRLERLKNGFRDVFPEFTYVHLDLGITSASEIARMIKSGATTGIKQHYDSEKPNARRPKTSKDREYISALKKELERLYLQTIAEYLRERQQRDIESCKRLGVAFTPKNLDDPDELMTEIRRVMGWKERKKNPVGFKKATLTREQELGWSAYDLGKGANPDDMLGSDRAAFMGASYSGDLKVKNSAHSKSLAEVEDE